MAGHEVPRLILGEGRALHVAEAGDAVGAAGEEGAAGGDGTAADRFAGDDGAMVKAVARVGFRDG
ncbi:MAG: hypothetical protein QOJ59_5539, partial [Thermomicrobiales bacterium]|nr:hypothetical protein [Thermomicrobiales bacterium]